MDAVQPWLLASGVAAGGGLLGFALSTILQRRRLARAARRLAAMVEAGAPPPTRPGDPLAPLLAAVSRHQAGVWQAREEQLAQRRALSADMVRLMNQNDGAMRARDRVLAAISHDLRQPLQAMDLALEQLRRHALPIQSRELAQLQSGMRTLTDVLDGLLLMSQLDAGALQPQATACNLQDLFAEVIAAQAESARRAGLELHARAGRHAVFTDPGMLAGMLGRLLDNAIKASAPGGRVLLAARRHGDGIRIEVRDGGVGIAPIHQPRVFDEFFQLGNPERDHRKGLGLGLAIVSRLATLLGTRVELRSRLREGSCLWLVLPRASVLQRPPRALLVDADGGQREALAALLASWGYSVDTESGIDAACARLGGAEPVDAVVCAIDAGDDDPGWALVRLAAARQPQAVRILLCTGPGPALLELAARHGAQVLSRPPAPSKLRSLLAQRPPALRGAA